LAVTLLPWLAFTRAVKSLCAGIEKASSPVVDGAGPLRLVLIFAPSCHRDLLLAHIEHEIAAVPLMERVQAVKALLRAQIPGILDVRLRQALTLPLYIFSLFR
jgi:hypothetical protein